MTKLVRLSMAMFAVIALGLAGAGSAAAAAPGNGAQQINYLDCLPTPEGNTACFTSQGVTNDMVIPSGNEHYFVHDTDCETITDPSGATVYQQCYTTNRQFLTRDAVTQELGSHSSEPFTGGGVTCTFTYAIHYANGQYQFQRISSSCV